MLEKFDRSGHYIIQCSYIKHSSNTSRTVVIDGNHLVYVDLERKLFNMNCVYHNKALKVFMSNTKLFQKLNYKNESNIKTSYKYWHTINPYMDYKILKYVE